ncbi:hypothetical protein G4B88_020078 [Cannabis sativa]|uniref:Uncharacterized protein n=1 Tax=Cannabis sativa TaxID=3483 RepID=A0A7J6GLF2_CANSA|nr:hypothetical protein G4B88_020078 [Cannabis sativa]
MSIYSCLKVPLFFYALFHIIRKKKSKYLQYFFKENICYIHSIVIWELRDIFFYEMVAVDIV